MAGAIFLLIVPLVFTLWVIVLWRRPRYPQLNSASTTTASSQRLLKPRTPDDCPAWRRQEALPRSARAPPSCAWRELKSRRAAPRRIITDGFAVPLLEPGRNRIARNRTRYATCPSRIGHPRFRASIASPASGSTACG